jgi:hypothetical protein
VEELPARPKPKAVSSTILPATHDANVSTSPAAPHTPSPLESITRAVVATLSTRAILMMAIFGAFVLTIMAMRQQNPWALATLALYCFSAIPAVVYLEIRRRE